MEGASDQTSVMLVVALLVGVVTAIVGYSSHVQTGAGGGGGGEGGQGASGAQGGAGQGQGPHKGKGRKPLHKHSADKVRQLVVGLGCLRPGFCEIPSVKFEI